jgi:subtilisin family serine protease
MNRRSASLCAAAALLAAIAALPATAMGKGERGQDEGRQNVIVVLKDSVAGAGSVAAEHARRPGVRQEDVYESALKGFSASVTDAGLVGLLADPRVAYVEPDGPVTAFTTQNGATWGLDRIDQPFLPLSTTFTYTKTGAGVTAYVIDTGIRTTHTEFGSRAVSGYDFVDNDADATDCNGHGTHVAGTIGGSTYGVAKGVSLVAVRVLNCSGSGTISGVIAGINYVTAQHQTGAPAVANMSLGGSASSALDTAVRNSIADGVSYAVAAGNGNWIGIAQDACKTSPARVTEAMTVSATDSTDRKASWANYGNCVDWFAPGVSITSAWSTSDSATATISGTSMATPHTAGVAALYLQGNPTASPATVRNELYNATTKNIVTSSKTSNRHLLFTSW